MNDTQPLTIDTAHDILDAEATKHLFMTPAQLTQRVLKCKAIAESTDHDLTTRALANRVGGHALEVLRSQS